MEQSSYVPYLKICDKLDLKAGDRVFIGSDLKALLFEAHRQGERFDVKLFIESFMDRVTPGGSIVLPTFNWGFCRGETFDYRNTPGKTGVMGNAALAMPEFRRTRHPIYSFAVYGRDREYLCGLENRDSFGPGTPFQHFHDADMKMLMIGLHWTESYTYVHHVSQISGKCWFRYHKDFTAPYVDENGEKSLRTYSMFVRRLDLIVDKDRYGKMVDRRCPPVVKTINHSPFYLTDFRGPTAVILEDLEQNHGENLIRPV